MTRQIHPQKGSWSLDTVLRACTPHILDEHMRKRTRIGTENDVVTTKLHTAHAEIGISILQIVFKHCGKNITTARAITCKGTPRH